MTAALAYQLDQAFAGALPQMSASVPQHAPALAPTPLQVAEQRRANRRAERTMGMIKVRGYRISVPCCIRNTSATGACVTINAGPVEDAAHLPDSIVLVFVREMVEIEAQIMWREGNRFGVLFTSRFRRTHA